MIVYFKNPNRDGLVVSNKVVNGVWAKSVQVSFTPLTTLIPFQPINIRLTIKSKTTVEVELNGVYFYTWSKGQNMHDFTRVDVFQVKMDIVDVWCHA